ncbi:Cyclic nucleotide-binding protein [Pseudocohnilembus persalinus]|uniref:Cyclic nucleotide-binding protein n=1 Tax=Pseudocohnilembus persalinus TaxID=266149 RepID=A0A0V0QAL4_PSEPJ|nr:Cyclic nucleotide-binding protein [Pseudocohnilembus persalinus]|eukprot:KRW99267.1 Cyclic nucleotide-binding protein [Pseudocohnilembus persalinus]
MEKNILQNEEIYSKQSLDQINSIQTNSMEISYNNLSSQEKCILKKFKGYQHVWTYLPGQNFGELALVHNEKRTATMVCQEDSCVMVLSREGFDSIIKSVYYKTVFKRYQFFEQFDFFKGIQRSILESFLHGLDSKLCKQNYIFYTDGQQLNNKIYFIKSGEIEISQIIDFQELENTNDQSNKKFGKLDTDINFMSSNQPHILNWGEQQKLKKGQNVRQRIVLKGPNCFFGEYEYLNEMQKRLMQAEVKTTAEVYELNAIDLINFLKIYEQGKDAFTLFKNDSNISIQWEKRHLNHESNKMVRIIVFRYSRWYYLN